MSQLETPISKSAREALTWAGFHVTRVQSGRVRVRGGMMHLAEPGTPDLLVQVAGPVHGWLECKAPDGEKRKSQKAWHAAAEKRGELVAVFTSAREAVEIACGWRRGFETENPRRAREGER